MCVSVAGNDKNKWKEGERISGKRGEEGVVSMKVTD